MERRSPALQDTRARIDECLRRAKLAGPQVRVVPLTGDASTRQYFRILRPDTPSVVLAVYDTAFAFEELPFVNVCRLFTNIPLPIPAIAGHADDLGILILEDLGDVTLQAHLGMTQPAEHDALYRQAVEFVFRMQRKGAELESPEYISYGIAFDRDKLMWELNFFVKHFLEAYRGVALTPAVRDALDEELLKIAGELAGEPRVLCHRDYHSRNLMLHDRQLYIIDSRTRVWAPTRTTSRRCCAIRTSITRKHASTSSFAAISNWAAHHRQRPRRSPSIAGGSISCLCSAT
jgi:aminoglycoside/choline kinase family phosphotransferase